MVLETTNHDCPYVRKHYNAKNMQTQQREAAAKGVVWLTVAVVGAGEQGFVTAAQANELTKSRNAAPAAVLLDPQSKIARAYGATVTPHMYIIDATGMLVYKGGIDSIPSAELADIPKAKQYVRVALDEVLAGKPVSRRLDPALRLLAEVPAHLDLTERAMPHDGWHPHDQTHAMSSSPPSRQPTRRIVLAAATLLPFGGASAQTVDAAQRIADAANRFLGLPRRRASASRR